MNFYRLIREKLRSPFSVLLKLDHTPVERSKLVSLSIYKRQQYIDLLIDAYDQGDQASDYVDTFKQFGNREDLDRSYELYQLSIQSYKDANEIYGKSEIVWNNYGCTMGLLADIQTEGNSNDSKTLEILWKAVRIRFLYHYAWFNLGSVYSCQGNLRASSFCYFMASIAEPTSEITAGILWSFKFLAKITVETSKLFYRGYIELSPFIYQMFYAGAKTLILGKYYIGQQLNFLQARTLPQVLQYVARKLQFIGSILPESLPDRKNSSEYYPEDVSSPEEIQRLQNINQLLVSRNSISANKSLEELINNCQRNSSSSLMPVAKARQTLENLLLDDSSIEVNNLRNINAMISLLNWLANHAISDFNLPYFDRNQAIDWENLGQSAVRQNRLLDALVSFSQAFKIAHDRLSARSWYSKGLAHFYREYYEDAIECFERAIELRPEWIEPFKYKGHAHNEIGGYSEAISSFNRFIHESPEHIWSWRGLATSRYHSYSYHAAIKVFQKLVSLKGDEPQFYLGLIQSFCGLDDFPKALSLLNDLLNLYITHWISYAQTVCLKLNVKDYQASVEDAEVDNIHFKSQPILCADFYHIVGKIAVDVGRSLNDDLQRRKWLDFAKENFHLGSEYLKELSLNDQRLNEQRLEIIEALISLCQALAEMTFTRARARALLNESIALQREGENLLARLLYTVPSKGKQLRLFIKFSSFSALRIDKLAQSRRVQDQQEALVYAEIHKNLCLEHIKNGSCNEQIDFSKINYQNILKALPNENTALVYWHISPAAVTTFIVQCDRLIICRVSQWGTRKLTKVLKYLYKLIATKSSRYIRGFNFPTNIEQLYDLEDWLSNWKKSYRSYRTSSIHNKKDHPWRLNMQKDLGTLARILGISRITGYLKNIDHIILIPHRDLHLLPLHLAFPDKVNIRYLPSVFFGGQSARELMLRNEGILFMGRYAPDLQFSRWEMQALKAFYPDRTLVIEGEEVKYDNLRGLRTYVQNLISTNQSENSSAAVTTFHFSGHAEHNAAHPWDSALALKDKPFNVRDILQNSDQFSQYKLVCLSACETGVTSSKEIVKEYIGLSSAFLAAGSDYIISSLWKVPDHITALLMVKFYSLLVSSQDRIVDFDNSMDDGLAISFEISSLLKQSQEWIRELTHEQLCIFLEEERHQIIFAKPLDLRKSVLRDFVHGQHNINHSKTLLQGRNTQLQTTSSLKVQSALHQVSNFCLKNELGVKSLILSMGFIPFPSNENTLPPDHKPYNHPYYWAGFTVTSLKA